ncbi:MAG: hypothetical protein ACLFPO_12340 [Spirochaetaceae bacterium]
MRVRIALIVLPVILLFAAQPLVAQDSGGSTGSSGALDTIDEALRRIADDALGVHITARITQGGEQTVWNMDVTRVTISGRAVTVRLDGSNVTVVARFTPYRDSGDSILLVAQGQTWISRDGSEESVDYQTAFESMPIKLGETVVFLPLGSNELTMDVETEQAATLNIELEVTVVPYDGETANE